MMTLLHLIAIQMIVVFVVDLSGAIRSLKRAISYLLTKGRVVKDDYDLKPFDCSLCSTFWVGLIYLLCTGAFSVFNVLAVCVLAFTARITKGLFLLVTDLIDCGIATIETKL